MNNKYTMHRRWFSIVTVLLTIQGVSLLKIAGIDGLIFYIGLFWSVLGMCATALTYRGRDIDVGSVTLTWSQFGGVATILIGLGWMAYPVGQWFDGEFGLFSALLTIASLGLVWGGIQMVRDHERARLLEPGESMRDRIETVGWSTHPLATIKDEALRSIGLFGLLFVPTMMIVTVDPSLSLSDPVVYLPAAVITLLHAAVVVWIRITTDAGPHYTQVLEGVRWW